MKQLSNMNLSADGTFIFQGNEGVDIITLFKKDAAAQPTSCTQYCRLEEKIKSFFGRN